ncbi:unnamed protein product [Staurois parvus]|uniref:Transposase n=1 Tax=Staurois parvus TaxID=386267 RepID=A0ABN9EPT3_9NEOB|nr:unnamed protein product [Staurois parvus]
MALMCIDRHHRLALKGSTDWHHRLALIGGTERQLRWAVICGTDTSAGATLIIRAH